MASAAAAALFLWCWAIWAAAVRAADESHLVTSLPGQPAVNFKQYAGQLVINEEHGRALFYWFFEADHPNASSLPLVLWLNGGPGCSSVGYGGLSELGPFQTNGNASGLLLNDYSWTKAANMIFLESPIGVGFSYSDTVSDFDVLHDKRTAEDAVEFLVRWFTKFPEYKDNDFYIAGESYAGHYIPTLAHQVLIHNRKARHHKKKFHHKKARHSSINLKGFAIGNPWTDAYYDNRGTFDFFYSHSLISDETYAGVLSCDLVNNSNNINNTKCQQALAQADKDVNRIDQYDIYAESCNPVISSSNKTASKRTTKALYLAAAYDPDPCLDSVRPYLNNPSVQAALHVVKKPRRWSGCSNLVNTQYSEADVETSMLPLYKKLIKTHHLRIWIYSGDADGVVPTTGTRAWIRELDLPIEVPWYAWDYNNQVGGWTQVYKGLTFATVRGSGHMVPSTKPEEALQVFKSFLVGEQLPSFN